MGLRALNRASMAEEGTFLFGATIEALLLAIFFAPSRFKVAALDLFYRDRKKLR